MKKEIRAIIIATIVTICIIIGCAQALPANAEAANPEFGEFYPKLTAVFEIEDQSEYRIVRCIDTSRNIWEFYDDGFEWEPGDIANLLMWNCNSQNPYDDEIIEVYWEGYDLTFYSQIMGWRR